MNGKQNHNEWPNSGNISKMKLKGINETKYWYIYHMFGRDAHLHYFRFNQFAIIRAECRWVSWFRMQQVEHTHSAYDFY